MHRLVFVCVGSLLASPMMLGQQRGSTAKMDPAKFLTQPLTQAETSALVDLSFLP